MYYWGDKKNWHLLSYFLFLHILGYWTFFTFFCLNEIHFILNKPNYFSCSIFGTSSSFIFLSTKDGTMTLKFGYTLTLSYYFLMIFKFTHLHYKLYYHSRILIKIKFTERSILFSTWKLSLLAVRIKWFFQKKRLGIEFRKATLR